MTHPIPGPGRDGGPAPNSAPAAPASVPRIKSRDLLRQSREIEIDHDGRVYRLRITQLNKLILTA